MDWKLVAILLILPFPLVLGAVIYRFVKDLWKTSPLLGLLYITFVWAVLGAALLTYLNH